MLASSSFLHFFLGTIIFNCAVLFREFLKERVNYYLEVEEILEREMN